MSCSELGSSRHCRCQRVGACRQLATVARAASCAVRIKDLHSTCRESLQNHKLFQNAQKVQCLCITNIFGPVFALWVGAGETHVFRSRPSLATQCANLQGHFVLVPLRIRTRPGRRTARSKCIACDAPAPELVAPRYAEGRTFDTDRLFVPRKTGHQPNNAAERGRDRLYHITLHSTQ